MFVSRKTALPAVGAIDVFPAEGHRWISQLTFQDRKRIADVVAFSRRLFRERPKYNRIALAIRFEASVRGGLDQLGRNQNLASVIDLDNHRELLPSMIIRIEPNPCAQAAIKADARRNGISLRFPKFTGPTRQADPSAGAA
jgi:hypothetical protein